MSASGNYTHLICMMSQRRQRIGSHVIFLSKSQSVLLKDPRPASPSMPPLDYISSLSALHNSRRGGVSTVRECAVDQTPTPPRRRSGHALHSVSFEDHLFVQIQSNFYVVNSSEVHNFDPMLWKNKWSQSKSAFDFGFWGASQLSKDVWTNSVAKTSKKLWLKNFTFSRALQIILQYFQWHRDQKGEQGDQLFGYSEVV